MRKETDPLITVPMPTVIGREDYLARAVESYEETANVEMLVYHDLTACGLAWIQGIDAGKGEIFHMGADDVKMHPGWWKEPVRLCKLGFLPAARILNADGTLQSCGDWEKESVTGTITPFTRSPIFTREQWEKLDPLVRPFLELGPHYYTDNIFSWAGRKLGMETVVCRTYEYTHYLADVKRGAGMTWNERMEKDHKLFCEYTEGK